MSSSTGDITTIKGKSFLSASGSTELGNIQIKYVGVMTACTYVLVCFFRLVTGILQSLVDNSSSSTDDSIISDRFIPDTLFAFIYAFIGIVPIMTIRKLYIQNSDKFLWSNFFGYLLSMWSIEHGFYTYIMKDYEKINSLYLIPGTEQFICPSHRKDSCDNLRPTINEYKAISITFNLALSVWYVIDHIFNKKYMLSFHIGEPRYLLDLHNEIWKLFSRKYDELFCKIIYTSIQFSVIFWILKLLFWESFFSYVVLYPWLRAPWFDIILFNRTVYCSIFIMSFWSLTHFLFDHFFTRIILVTGKFVDPNAMLVDGLHAFMELWHISKYDHERRNLIYSDFNRKQPYECPLHNNPISTWTEISYSCMDLIMKLTNDAEKELEVVHGNLEVNPTLDTLKKDPIYTELYYLERYHLIFGDKHKIIRKLYALFIVPIFKESIEYRTAIVCKDFYTVIFAIQSLTTLTTKSIKEDKYGVVQNHISPIFESLLLCLILLENYVKEPPLNYWDIGDPYSTTSSKVLAEPDSLISLYMTFRESMDYVKLTDITNGRLNKLYSSK
ncbi:11854_t:CDS:10 [Entrophospora sp. SA101]|nr:11854_t:CDS:10 [Entrophospora sp. SA101]CAJ0914940.1 4801_t:CDS:10 [Entrophospora sp. SA101]CAJ0914951.1 4804_t:CDS:10 [Entrophospora sp. SA101]